MLLQNRKALLLAMCCCVLAQTVVSQQRLFIAGRVVDSSTQKPLAAATVQLAGGEGGVVCRQDGSFSFTIPHSHDSLNLLVSCVGYRPLRVAVPRGNAHALLIQMLVLPAALQTVTVSTGRRPGKSFMQKVLEHKQANNPERFNSYSYQRYTRNELDMDNVDFKKLGKTSIQGLMAGVYSGLDTNSIADRELPVYFVEYLAQHYHGTAPAVEQDNITAKKTLGLKTDELLRHLEKFYLNLNVYDNWLQVFTQSFVSPLNDNAFSFYHFYLADSSVERGRTTYMVRFVPKQAYEKAFTGNLWIIDSTYAVTGVELRLNEKANLNFVKTVEYSVDYKPVVNSVTGEQVYMPYKLYTEVNFESGLALLGIPVPENRHALHFANRNTTIFDHLQVGGTPLQQGNNNEEEAIATSAEKNDAYWNLHRPASLSPHEKNIYRMVDSLKNNRIFQRDVKLVAFAGTGYWDFADQWRIGPYSSFLSGNKLEGMRTRLGIWSLPGISKKMNLYGYLAYGSRDERLKGGAGIKYLWNQAKFTKTTLWYGSDYDYIIDQDDELDKDNLISSLFRKNVPFSRTYVRQVLLKHEQYLTRQWSIKSMITYKELRPVFNFSYRPINPASDKPYDSLFKKVLPVTEAAITLRYAKNERITILNYDQIHIASPYPVFSLTYAYGFELSDNTFDFHKLNASVEQNFALPPMGKLYYNLSAGKTFGTLPYIILNIPPGNEYYVSSKYVFNTMIPYEFAADTYAALHTRMSFQRLLLGRLPFLQKMGWRERFSFNAFTGSMTQANRDYNKNAHFHVTGKTPFMEAGLGIENILHVLSVEYFRRLTHLNDRYAQKGGIYLGVTLSF